MENKRGYQRIPAVRRFSEDRGSIVRYLMKEIGCFPTSILLNVRGARPEHESPDFRKPLDLEFWSKEHGPLQAVTMNKNTIQQFYKNLNKKINLAQES